MLARYLLLAAALPGTGLAHQDDGPPRLALLVGIDDYSGSPAVPALGGCVNDVRRAREVLVGRFGFAAEDVLVLENEAATAEGVVRAFEQHLLRRAGPSTEVVVWFSGHGSRVPDRSGVAGAELGQLDSSFLAWDSRRGGRSGEYDLGDDLFRSLVAALSERTERILWVSDACHSGASLRGGALPEAVRSAPVGERSIDPKLFEPFWPASVPLLEDREEFGSGRARYAHVAACAPDQLAQEVRVVGSDGVPVRHGALSWFLCLALEDAQPGASIQRVAQEAAVRLTSEVPSQSVWCEGVIERELFGSGFARRATGFIARVRSGRLWFQAGAAHGLRVGSRLEVLDNADDAQLATARIERLTALEGLAVFEDGSSAGELEGRVLRVVEVARPEGVDELAVHAEGEGMRALLERVAGLRLTALEDAELVLAPRGGRLRLGTREGFTLLLADLPAQDTSERSELTRELERRIAIERRFRALFDLASQPGQYRLEVSFLEPTVEQVETARADLERSAGGSEPGASALGAARIRARAPEAGSAASPEWICEGEAEQLLGLIRIRNPYERDLHVAVLSVFEDRSRNLIWPRKHERDNVIAAGQERTVRFLAVEPASWPLERPARDRYLVIATEGPADFSSLEEESQLRGASSAPGASELPGVLREAVEARAVRGGRERDVADKGWGVTHADLWIVPHRH